MSKIVSLQIPGDLARKLAIETELFPRVGAQLPGRAPGSRNVMLELAANDPKAPARKFNLHPEPGGYFSGANREAKPGMRYEFALDSGSYPDTASRLQPEGPHGPSQIKRRSAFGVQSLRGRRIL